MFFVMAAHNVTKEHTYVTHEDERLTTEVMLINYRLNENKVRVSSRETSMRCFLRAGAEININDLLVKGP